MKNFILFLFIVGNSYNIVTNINLDGFRGFFVEYLGNADDFLFFRYNGKDSSYEICLNKNSISYVGNVKYSDYTNMKEKIK